MVEQSQVCEGLFEITLRYRSFVSDHAPHVREMRQYSRDAAKAATHGKTLSPVGHIREYSCVLQIAKDRAPEVGHKHMSECHAWCRGGAACRDRMLEHFTIRCDGRRLRGQRLCVPGNGRGQT
jgi:hypothetical protein